MLALVLVSSSFVMAGPGMVRPAQADHTPDPASVTVAGSFQEELGCPGDWQPDCADTHLVYDAEEDVWQATFSIAAGNWEYKAALNDGWAENYGAHAQPGGANIALSLSAATDVRFYYDHKSHWVIDDQNAMIVTVPGSFQSELGCAGDWDPACLRSWLQDPDGDGIYTFATGEIPAGDYHAKVAIGESWDENYGAGGVPNGPDIPFTVPFVGAEMAFSFDSATKILTITAPPPPVTEWYVRGSFNAWGTTDPMYDDGTHGDLVAGDGVYTAAVVIGAASRHEFKVATADWAASFPGSNSWLYTTMPGQEVTITLDTGLHDDGWLPAMNIVGVSSEPSGWTAVGDWQGWNNANPATVMEAVGGGIYEYTTAIAIPGSYQYKAVRTGTWDAIGADGRSVDAATVPFETTDPGQTVIFHVDALAGRVRVDVEPVPPVPKLDNDIWWDGLGHNSRSDLYRVPGGAVPAGTPVMLRFRTYHGDVGSVTVRVWSTAAGAQSLIPMELVATTDDEPYGYDYWQATLSGSEEPTIFWYRFIVRDGSDEDYYEDDDLFDGGWGVTYDDSPDYSFQIDVYDPAFSTPDWMKNAIVYQVFPDRFYNGDVKLDPSVQDPSVYGNPVLLKDWDELPEGYCRGYEDVACGEGPQGRDFYGGDLQGVKDKLGYLAELGVTAIYFNPIFEAPSNHLYDTTDYFRIDPYLGSKGTLQSLINQAEKKGIRIILDGVFNHTSSDSVYFDRYSRYSKEGAFESLDSRYFDWYTFYEWPEDYNSWWGFDSLPVLAEVDGVRDLIYGADRSVARWWIEGGAAGWRLDVAPDKSHEFWREFRPRVKEVDPEAIIIGEIWDDASPWILGDELDTTMNYRFRRAMLGFLNGDSSDPNQGSIRGLNPEQFNNALQSIKEDYPPAAYETAMNLVGTHDTQRILWALTPGARNREDREFNAANVAEGKAKQKLMALMQMTMPGAPTIYYGDEVGLTGDTDPDDRRPFPWDSMDTDMLAHYQALTGLRNGHSFLRTGSFDRLYVHNADGTYAYGRKDLSGAAVVAVNRDTAIHGLTIDLRGYIPEGTVLTDALTGVTVQVTGGQIAVDLEGRQGAILLTPQGTDLVPPEPPTGLQASGGDGLVELAWDTVPGATGYYVYRSPVSGGGYRRLNETPQGASSYSDTTVANGRLYYYVVTAVDKVGNESARSNEAEALPHLTIGWANLQWPPHIDHVISALFPTENVYGQVWIDGHTQLPGPTEGLLAEVGYGPGGSHPEGHPDWLWVPATFNVDAGSNDEFMGQLLPEVVGTYDFAYRYSTTAGRTWVYADLDGTGNGYDPAKAGDLVVIPSADNTPPDVPQNLRLVEASPSFIHLAWDAVADADLYGYEVYRGDETGGPYSQIAQVLAPSAEYSDWDVATGESYAYIVVAVDTSFNRSGDSSELLATAQPRAVQVTFNATLPDTTPPGDSIYMGGSFNGWNPGGTLMARVGLFATVTLTFYEGDHLEYKYTRGDWTTVEKDASCGEIGNRTLTVLYGSDGAMTVEDMVLNWRNTAPCED
jgi:glycosidase